MTDSERVGILTALLRSREPWAAVLAAETWSCTDALAVARDFWVDAGRPDGDWDEWFAACPAPFMQIDQRALLESIVWAFRVGICAFGKPRRMALSDFYLRWVQRVRAHCSVEVDCVFTQPMLSHVFGVNCEVVTPGSRFDGVVEFERGKVHLVGTDLTGMLHLAWWWSTGGAPG